MKFGKVLIVALTLTLGVTTAFAQSIDVLGDLAGTTCQANIAPGGTPNIYIMVRTGGPAAGGITGAEFFVNGWPTGWLAVLTANPASNVALGDPFKEAGGNRRANVGFPTCQSGSLLLLYTVTVIPTSVVPQTYLQVGVAVPPTNVTYLTPIVTLCDAPDYTAVAAAGGNFIINPGVGVQCTVGVEQTTWSGVKGLYAN